MAKKGTRNRTQATQSADISALPDVFRTGLTPQQIDFLWHFITLATINKAAKVSGIVKGRHYDWLRKEPYATCFKAAKDHIGDAIDEEIRRRALEGVVEPVFGKEGRIGFRRRFSDSLAALVAQAYCERYRSASGVTGARVEVVHYGASPPPPGWTADGGVAPEVRVSLPSKADRESPVPPENAGDSAGSPPPDSPGERPGRQNRI